MQTVDHYLVDNRAGWRLAVTRVRDPEAPATRSRPVVVVPGYGMNSFIFGFHPKGPSLVDTLAARGLEVWTFDFRGQGRSIRGKGSLRYGIGELAIDDLGCIVQHVLANTRTEAREVDLVGCSLGTAMAFAYVASVPKAPVRSLVSMAGLVTWQKAHPLVRLAFGSRRLASLFRMRNTRGVARVALPVLARVAPSLLSVYLNERSTDLSQAARMVQTVEDPHPVMNREIAHWIRQGELVVRGVNVSRALPTLDHPFLCVVANDDGIVPPATARHPYDVIGSSRKELRCVGDADHPIAHADLFLCNDAVALVFTPIADFLLSVA